MPSVPAFSAGVVQEFCKICHWAYELWQTASVLLSQKALEAMDASKFGDYFYRVQEAVRQAYLLEIEKLHDAAVMGDRINLTLSYVRDYGGWDPATRGELEKLAKKMDGLHRSVKPARNRLLAHNDLATIIDGKPLGGYPAGEDEEYFDALKSFATLVSERSTGTPFLFGDFGKRDAEAFLATLSEAGDLPP